jgi:hypothetical protein
VSSTNDALTDDQIVAALDVALEAARAELANLEPQRDALVARIAQLELAKSSLTGETKVPAYKLRAAARKPRAKRVARAKRTRTPATAS